MTNGKPQPKPMDVEKWCGLVAAIFVGNLLTILFVYGIIREYGLNIR